MSKRLFTDIEALELVLPDGFDDKDNMLPVPGVDAADSSSQSDFDPSMADGLSSKSSIESDDDEGLLAVTMDARSRSSSRSPIEYSIKCFRS